VEHTGTTQARLTAKPVVFLDFDGTITRRDVTDAILDAYAGPEWLQAEQAWQAGLIGSRECLTRQMALVDASADQIDALLDGIEIDPGLAPLFDACAARGVSVHIVSEGFDYCIERILLRPSLDLAQYLRGIQIVSAHVEPNGRRWEVAFPSAPCVHGCGTCKPATMDRLNRAGAPLVFAGDGLSDRHAAGHADWVFAKARLAAFCDQQAIAYTPYDTLATVARWLGQRVWDDTRMSPTI
jgi:2,3-diketo-5-methylthio-1-phosphopentane phosphatase